MNNWLYDLYDDLYDLYDLYDYFEDVQFFSYGTYNAPKKNNQKYKSTFFLHLIFSHKLNSTYLFFNPNDTWLTNKDSM